MPNARSIETQTRDTFGKELERLCVQFREQSPDMRARGFDEARLRLEFLDPMFSALGWNVWNNPPQPMYLRDVVVENRTDIKGKATRVDYAFRTNGLERWVCEAKKPFDGLNKHYFQTQNYIYSMRLWVGILSDFENLILFVVGGKPSKLGPFSPVPGWKLHYSTYTKHRDRMWDLLSRESVEQGSLEKFVQGLGKISAKQRQGWLIKPDRTKAVDEVFLSFLEKQRVLFAKDLVRKNAGARWTGEKLADCLQTLFDRLLFQRVSEDRGIDVGTSLHRILLAWEGKGKVPGQLWESLSANFKHLSSTFNGGVFGKDSKIGHLIDSLLVSDTLLADFIEEIAGDGSSWLFGTMPVWLLGSVYERFLASEPDAKGNISRKPGVAKSGGVYYTPAVVVSAVVSLTVDPLLVAESPAEILKLRFLAGC